MKHKEFKAPLSDAAYMQTLRARLDTLKAQLTEKSGESAPLTQRVDKLIADFDNMLAHSNDDTVIQLFELSLWPRMEKLLFAIRQHFHTQNFAFKVSTQIQKQRRREQSLLAEKQGPAIAPPVPDYKPLPTPIRSEERRALIEEALGKLKALLQE